MVMSHAFQHASIAPDTPQSYRSLSHSSHLVVGGVMVLLTPRDPLGSGERDFRKGNVTHVFEIQQELRVEGSGCSENILKEVVKPSTTKIW